MTLSGQDFSNVLKAPFQDKQWGVNLILQGALLLFLSFFIIGVPFLTGFMLAITRRTINNDPTLPNWEWGRYFKDGMKMLGVGIVYIAPLLAAWIGVFVLFFVSVLLVNQNDVFAVLTFVSALLMMGMYVLNFLFVIFMMFVQQAYVPLVAIGAPLRECFQFKTYIWPYLKHNIGNILLGILLGYLAGIIASVGMVFLFVGYFFTFPYAIAVMANVYGLVYRQSVIQYKGA